MEMCDPASWNENIAVKRARMDTELNGQATSSCVLHLRGFPSDITEQEIANLAVPFGLISNMVVNKRNFQAFIEFEDKEAAESMFQFYKTVCPPFTRGGNTLDLEYSKYASLTTGNNQNIINAISNANKQFSQSKIDVFGNRPQVLHVHVDQSVSNRDIGYMPFYHSFRRYGPILRVISFKKNDGRHAFLEFDSPFSALVAKSQMVGMPILSPEDNFPRGIVTRIEFSRQLTLEVHREDQNSRNFVENPLKEPHHFNAIPSSGNPNFNAAKIEADGLTEEKLYSLDPTTLVALAGRLVKPLLNLATNAFNPQNDLFKTQAETLAGLVHFTNNAGPNARLPGRESISGSQDGINKIMDSSVGSPVVFVSNLNKERVTPDTLFLLFGVYGDVQRVKIMYNKKDTALVQLTDSVQSQRAVQYLNGIPLYGEKIRCTISKNPSILMPLNGRNDSDDANTCDYSSHLLHRFKRANSRNHANICPPSSVLHVSHLPPTITEASLKTAFEQTAKSDIKHIKILQTEKKMALIGFEDLDKAISALIAMHDYPIEENYRIRISFSKVPIVP